MSGQRLRLVQEVMDDETGYRFPAGAPGEFEEHLGSTFCLVALEKALGDSSDSGTTEVRVRYDDIEPA